MSAERRVTSLWTKRVNLWLYWDIFRSALMHVDESRELVERIGDATLFKESCIKYMNKKEMDGLKLLKKIKEIHNQALKNKIE